MVPKLKHIADVRERGASHASEEDSTDCPAVAVKVVVSQPKGGMTGVIHARMHQPTCQNASQL
jgi:hypothetical protein